MSRIDPGIDWTEFDQLAGDVGPEAMARLLQTFYGEAQTRLARFGTLSAADSPQGEGSELHREIHSLKSAAGSFGASALAASAARIEAAIEALAYRHDAGLLAELGRQFADFQAAVAAQKNRNI